MCERENRLIKNDMTRDDDFVGSKVKAAVTFVMSRVSQKDAHDRMRGVFMWGSGRDVWIALTAKDTEMRIRRWGAEQGCMRRGEVQCLGGKDVEELGRGVECLNPEGGGMDA